ncbi:putative monooxygenase p33MONOX [Myxocyprinus asiaticus]|uniref:putative monooxygenase p33MONOX n=1 Tax=Myxocyprinus asiaticus TaxID=70543 RepID=UPI00222253FD|nr:putative monooxygenase p33MONOX [Myxocyprinus asiaticus]
MEQMEDPAGSDNKRAIARKSQSKISSVITSVSMGGNEGGGQGGERWNLFRVRPIVQKSPTDPGSETNTPGGFTLQSYFGVQKSKTMDAVKAQVNVMVEDPANFQSTKMEMSGEEGKKTSCHRLRHRDMNILTPSGF